MTPQYRYRLLDKDGKPASALSKAFPTQRAAFDAGMNIDKFYKERGMTFEVIKTR